MIRLFAVLPLLLAARTWAQQAPAQIGGEAIKQLSSAASHTLAPVADGSVKKNDDGTETVAVDRNVLLETKNIPLRRHCYPDDSGPIDGRHAGYRGRTCDETPAHTVKDYGDRYTIRIVDRDEYVKSEGRSGAGIGALVGGGIGLLGFFALFAGPIGWAIGAATVLIGAGVGAGIGYGVAKKKAEDKPDVFVKTEKKWSESSN